MAVSLRRYFPLLAVFCAIKLAIHLVGNRNYGFHRDELLHLSVAQHPSFGFMEFPPLIAWIGNISWHLFGDSVSGLRIFSTLAGIAILILCCAIATEFGGKRNAVLLSGVAILSFLPFYRNHMLFQPVAFDQLFWTFGFYLIVKFYNSNNKKYLLWLGIVAGFGILNKYTFFVWSFAVALGFLFYNGAAVYKSKWIYIGSILALLIIIPNVFWQFQHDFPILKHLEALKRTQLDEMQPYEFVIEQVKSVFTFSLGLIGLGALLFVNSFSRYRTIAIMVIAIFGIMWISGSKGYYFFAAYPVLFAAAAVAIEKKLHTPAIYVIAGILFLPAMYFLPKAIPILPIDKFIAYENIKPDKDGHYELTSDYADTFGWPEQVKLIAETYNSLSDLEKKNCVILAQNYGEAGAIKVLGKRYNLPDPVCASGSFWLFGPGTTSGKVCISIGFEQEILAKIYAHSKLITRITNRYAIEEENNIPIFINKEPILDLRTIWPSLEKDIFN